MISVIIVNWNGKTLLQRSIPSVLGQSFSDLELIVVDNGSIYGSPEYVASLRDPRRRLLRLEKNRGFAGGANAGIRAARGNLIALLNNDAVAEGRWLEELCRGLTSPDVGMVAGKILSYADPRVIDKAGHLMYPDGMNRGRGCGELDRGQYDRMEQAFFPDGCAALYRRSMLDEIGLFDEQFFAYGDDAELGVRAAWAGWKCTYVPTARVFHLHSQTLGPYSPEKILLVERNRLWLAVKLFPWPMILISPWYTFQRLAAQAFAALSRQGAAGQFVARSSVGQLALTILRAYLSAFRGLPLILRKRRTVLRRLPTREFCRLIKRYRITLRQMVLSDPGAGVREFCG